MKPGCWRSLPLTLFIILPLICVNKMAECLLFRVDQFTDLTKKCIENKGQVRFILNEANPAMYVSVDQEHGLKKKKRAERNR